MSDMTTAADASAAARSGRTAQATRTFGRLAVRAELASSSSACRTLPPSCPLPTLPEVAFAGRSNVGKSSLINASDRAPESHRAHIQHAPGRTRA